MVTTVAGHAYPWDVLGDPAFPERAAGLGVRSVTLAAAYHSCRAATPLHPARQVVDASYAALYRPVRPEAWTGRLVPRTPGWMAESDPFGEAAGILRAAGLPVTAWVVLTHNTRLGTAHPDVAVVNCFGERYPYALCPQWAEVRGYAATLAAEACRDVPLDGVSLEACGQLGITHLSHHEKTDGAWSPASARLLSVCCCGACRRAWRDRGLDDHRLVADLRAVVRALSGSTGIDAPVADLIGAEEAWGVLATRHSAAAALREEVLAGLPAGVPVTLHASPDPWATGPSPGLPLPDTGAVPLPGVAGVLVPAWPVASATAAGIGAMRAAVGPGVDVGAYVTVLAPTAVDDVPTHARRLRAAGADGLHLYHLGLAPSDRHKGLTRAIEAFEAP
ncbi:hypothetical protein [Longispora urticae]